MDKGKKSIGEKTDKRILYTKMVLKEAFLNELKKNSYDDIGIVKLCDSAQISRSAFYLHYDSLDDLLREVVDEALDSMPDFIKMILGNYGTDKLEMPDSDRERDIYDIEPGKYKVLIHQWAALNIIMEIIADRFKTAFISDLVRDKGISEEYAEIVFFFQLAGFLTAVDKAGEDSVEKIKLIRNLADHFTDNVQVLME